MRSFVMRTFVMSSAVLLCAACGGAGGPAVCGNLARAPSCSSTAGTQCTEAIESAKSSDSTCAPHLAALVECLGSLEVSCTGTKNIAAVGDGMFGAGQNFTDIGGFSVVVNDSKCDVHRRGLEACRTCATAVGAKEVGVLGIADKCGAGGASCASGLSCQGGICTRSCSSDADCDARADGCRLQYQYKNVCASGVCTRSCGDAFVCKEWIGPNSSCVSRACSL